MFVEVVLPVKLSWNPTYRTEIPLHRGQRVHVRLANKAYIGTVLGTDAVPYCDPEKIQEIDGIAEGLPDISEAELKFWKFISDYYLCTLGEVYKAAYPGTEVKSEESAARRKKRTAPSLEDMRDIPDTGDILFPTLKAGKPVLLEDWDRTETYMNVVRECLGSGSQALILAPDCINYAVLKNALESNFPEELHCLNSRTTAARRRKASDAVRKPFPAVILGTRSSIFLPYSKLGLIIVDEEQDTSFKQDSPAPRYNARDCAIVLSNIHKAKILLGTCCPSLESLLNCRNGKYALFERNISERPGAEIIDVSAEKRKRGMNGNFSRKLLDACGETAGKIALVRGWEKTEDLTDEVARLLPGREVDILSMTEARRTDLSEYSLVAVLQIDALAVNSAAAAKLNRNKAEKPDYSMMRADFRTDEHLLQLCTSLRGRCRRLVIQTAKPSRIGLGAEELLSERRQFNFPPYSRLVEIRNRKGEIIDRRFLKKGPESVEEKKSLAAQLPFGCIIDVDPS